MSAPRIHVQVLAGLPGEGPIPRQYSASGQGTHREGYVVEFRVDGSDPWVGNFQPGLNTFYSVVPDLVSDLVTVIAGGQGYTLDPESGRLARQFGGSITSCERIPDQRAVLFTNGLWFSLVRGDAEIWRTNRLSWDGMRNVQVHDGKIRGESWHFDGSWHEFEVDLSSGSSHGGAYIEIKPPADQ